jgi:2-keto-3-deoxy-L-rhamnonate aldolase RhmA
VNHPEVRAVMDKAITDIVKAGRVAGTLAVTEEAAERAIDMGVRALSVPWTTWIAAGARSYLGAVAAKSK